MERQAESLINHLPIGNGVIVRKRMKIRGGILKIAKSPNDIIEGQTADEYRVFGFGNLTNTIKLNDLIGLRNTAQWSILDTKDNENDVLKVFNKYHQIKSGLIISPEDVTIPDFVFIDTYAITDFYNVVTVITENE